jgi:hypothetical protein
MGVAAEKFGFGFGVGPGEFDATADEGLAVLVGEFVVDAEGDHLRFPFCPFREPERAL